MFIIINNNLTILYLRFVKQNLNNFKYIKMNLIHY